MIVEDSPIVADALSRYLRKRGYGAVAFHTGQGALSHVESIRPRACIVDIHLPDISGLILIQRLRDRLGLDVPIVVLSGDASMATINSLTHVGATYFFSKPVNPALLLERLEQLMAA